MKKTEEVLGVVGVTGAGATAGFFAAGIKGLLIGTGTGGIIAGVTLWLLNRKKAPVVAALAPKPVAAVAAAPKPAPVIHIAAAVPVHPTDPTKLADGSPNPVKLPNETVAQYKARGGWAANMKLQLANRAKAAAAAPKPPAKAAPSPGAKITLPGGANISVGPGGVNLGGNLGGTISAAAAAAGIPDPQSTAEDAANDAMASAGIDFSV